MPNEALMAEARRRGIVADPKSALQKEALRRGLVSQAGPLAPGERLLAPGLESGVSVTFEQPRTQPSMLERGAQKVDDFVRGAADVATFGAADEIAAGLSSAVGSGTYEENLEYERERNKAADPVAYGAGQVAGGLGTGLGLARQGVTFLRGAQRTLPSLAGRGAAEGAAYGAAQGFGRGEGGAGERAMEATRGAATGALTGAALGGLLRGITRGKNIPTADAVRQQATKAYQAAEDAGIIIKGDSIGDAVQRINMDLAEAGFDKGLHPRAARALERLQEAAGQNHTLKGMEILRRVTKSAGKTIDPDEGRIVGIIMDNLDDFVGGLKKGDVLMSGDPARGVRALQDARRLYAISARANNITDLVDNAAVRAGNNYTGAGFEHALRSEFKNLYLNKRRLRGYSKAEQEAIRKVSSPSALSGGNIMRELGKLAPTGIVSLGLGQVAGYSLAGPVGQAVIPAVGILGRTGATLATKGRVSKVLDKILEPVTTGPTGYNPLQRQMLTGSIIGAIEGRRAAQNPNRGLTVDVPYDPARYE